VGAGGRDRGRGLLSATARAALYTRAAVDLIPTPRDPDVQESPDSTGADRWIDPDPTAPASAGKTHGGAIASVVLPLLPCLPALGGLLGVALGVMARGEIERSGGKQRGAGLAATGIVLGAIHLAVSVALVGALITLAARPSSAPPTAPHSTPAPPPIATKRGPPPSPPEPSAARPSPSETVRTSQIGDLTLVDLEPGTRGLRAELLLQKERAAAAGKRLLVWLVAADCAPCDGVATALSDRLMQTALRDTLLVRLQVRDFHADLKYLGIPVEKVPGFVLIGDAGEPTDYVDGGEWDADIAANIAPVLGKFVRGTYGKRRDPWRGGKRRDETPL
jgi:hypothetical protein